jgi:uncharacterized membrane protein
VNAPLQSTDQTHNTEDSRRLRPAHIVETVQATARLHREHDQQATPLQRVADRMTTFVGRPTFLAILSVVVFFWVCGNLAAILLGYRPWDQPPFNWLQGFTGLTALYVTAMILATQRREDELAGYREQLTLELAILGEQKSAKIIALLEEIRRDDPYLKNRVDQQAVAMSMPSDAQSVLDAIRGTHDELMTGESRRLA